MAIKFKNRNKQSNLSAPPAPQEEAPVDYEFCKYQELKKRYPQSFNSWKNMKTRIKTHGAVVHESISSFKDFLICLGHCEKPGYTLDRIDNTDPEYKPGKVRWADKKTQSNNKSDNVLLTYEGHIQTIAQWAEDTGQPSSTLYWRKDQGWSDKEIIEGKTPTNLETIHNPFPHGQKENYESRYINRITTGGYLSKLEYLFNVSEVGRDNAQEKCADLSFELERLEQQEADVNKIAALKERLGFQTFITTQSQKIMNECKQQIKYDTDRDGYFKKLDNHDMGIPAKVKKEYKAKFYEAHPRPPYTINTPQFQTNYQPQCNPGS